MTVSPPVPADATGRYPELVGYHPISTERRSAVYCVDALLGIAAGAVAWAVLAVTGRSTVGMVVSGIVVAGYYVAVLWALFGRSARLAGVLMRAQYVGVETGAKAPGRLLLSFLLQGLTAAVSLGIWPLIAYFATIRGPFRRNWFDRLTGLMLVDGRLGRRPGTPAPAPPQYVGPPPVASVQFPAEAAVPWTPKPTHDNPVPGFGSPSPAPRPDYDHPVPGFGAPIDAPASPPGLITSTPFGASTGRRDMAAPEAPQAAPVIRDMRSVAAHAPDSTEVVVESGPGRDPVRVRVPTVTLSDGRTIRLVPPAVLGRNPQPPAGQPDAVPYPVDDPLASKTHLLLGADDGAAWVVDLHSTNGVWQASSRQDAPAKIEPGRRVTLPVGAVVHFGGQSGTVG